MMYKNLTLSILLIFFAFMHSLSCLVAGKELLITPNSIVRQIKNNDISIASKIKLLNLRDSQKIRFSKKNINELYAIFNKTKSCKLSKVIFLNIFQELSLEQKLHAIQKRLSEEQDFSIRDSLIMQLTYYLNGNDKYDRIKKVIEDSSPKYRNYYYRENYTHLFTIALTSQKVHDLAHYFLAKIVSSTNEKELTVFLPFFTHYPELLPEHGIKELQKKLFMSLSLESSKRIKKIIKESQKGNTYSKFLKYDIANLNKLLSNKSSALKLRLAVLKALTVKFKRRLFSVNKSQTRDILLRIIRDKTEPVKLRIAILSRILGERNVLQKKEELIKNDMLILGTLSILIKQAPEKIPNLDGTTVLGNFIAELPKDNNDVANVLISLLQNKKQSTTLRYSILFYLAQSKAPKINIMNNILLLVKEQKELSDTDKKVLTYILRTHYRNTLKKEINNLSNIDKQLLKNNLNL